jgi:hypothetical protein
MSKAVDFITIQSPRLTYSTRIHQLLPCARQSAALVREIHTVRQHYQRDLPKSTELIPVFAVSANKIWM